MSKMKALIPNLLTAGNLVGGVLAIIFSLTGRLEWAPYCIFISAFLDFFDGFAARLLKVQSELGKQLDSLADMVTFGVAPGVMVFVLMKFSFLHKGCMSWPPISKNGFGPIYTGDLKFQCLADQSSQSMIHSCSLIDWERVQPFYAILPYFALLIPIMSMFRLAKFNLDTRQTDSFIGVPTPANTLFFASLPLILIQLSYPQTPWNEMLSDFILNPLFLIISTIIMSILLVAELPLFALKFKSFGWKGNEIRYIFLTLCVVLLATLWWLAIPLIIILYILLSLIQNLRKKNVAAKTSK
jgi:CDP-diacylglycerol--serine O-phosphatidyltransferase